MSQVWQKLGNIFSPNNEYEWLHSHASVPIAEHIKGDTYKIYFSCRDQHNRSHTAFIVIDITTPSKIISMSTQPVLSPGKLGTFDDSGAMGSWLVNTNDQKLLYYIGWNLGKTVPFRNSIGLASLDGGQFKRCYSGPIVDRTKDEPHFCASCAVLKDQNKWKMWYLSCTDWLENEDGIEHRYHIKYAESEDGINWKRNGMIAIDYANDQEVAISRPSVLKTQDNQWHMWYSYRTKKYRIGYAKSKDGIHWHRSDNSIILDVSKQGWDSDMIEYPFVFQHKNGTYMLYNGNEFGRTGIGLAVLNSPI